MEYEEVIRAIVESETVAVGTLAYARIDHLSFIDVEDDEISFTRAVGRTEVEAVIDEFKEIQGEGAVGIARRALVGTLTTADHLDLPPAIVPQSVKENDFVSGL